MVKRLFDEVVQKSVRQSDFLKSSRQEENMV